MALTRCTLPGPGPHAAALGFQPVGPITETRIAGLTADNAYLQAARDAAVARVIEVQAGNHRLAQVFQAENQRFVLELRDERDRRLSEQRNLRAAVTQLAGIAQARDHQRGDHRDPRRNSPRIAPATPHEQGIRSHASTASATETEPTTRMTTLS